MYHTARVKIGDSMQSTEAGLKIDDDPPRLQQKQRQDMSADFDTLKSKGHKPFDRESSLKVRQADKTSPRGMGQTKLQMPGFSATCY